MQFLRIFSILICICRYENVCVPIQARWWYCFQGFLKKILKKSPGLFQQILFQKFHNEFHNELFLEIFHKFCRYPFRNVSSPSENTLKITLDFFRGFFGKFLEHFIRNFNRNASGYPQDFSKNSFTDQNFFSGLIEFLEINIKSAKEVLQNFLKELENLARTVSEVLP